MSSINPKLIIKPVIINKPKIKTTKVKKSTKKKKTTKNSHQIQINVIRDDYLPAGTKQRAMIPYFKKQKETEFVYVSPYTGGAQITLAYATQKTKKYVTLFINKVRPRHPLTTKALKLADPDKFKLIEVANGSFKKMRQISKEYIHKVKQEKGINYITEIALGFDNPEYHSIFVEQLQKALPAKLKKNPPKRMWVPSGSATILNALYKVFPKTYFLAVQTGRTIWPDQLIPSRTTLYKSTEFFYDKAQVQPPYPTTKAYDAKAWKFVLKYGKNDDYIWNVTKDAMDIDYQTYKDKDYNFDYLEIQYQIETTPYLEYIRHIKWKEIIHSIVTILKKQNVKLVSGNKSLYEVVSSNLAMWLSINLMDKSYLVDPFIPYQADKNEVFINTLVYLGKLNLSEAKKLFHKFNLVNKCNKVVEHLSSLQENTQQNNQQNKQEINNSKLIVKNQQNRNIYSLYNKNGKKLITIQCQIELYKRLKKRFMLPYKELESKIFCLLLRYQTLMGNSHQFAMRPHFKNALREEYGINFECFASAINVHYSRFCSLFYDIERHFGSYGSFYLMKYKRGFFIANPPYENKMLELMVLKFIESCQNTKEPLSISFGLPNWGKYAVFEAMEIIKGSKYTKFVRCMKDREVEWFDRLNNIKVRIPSHCRCVVQNKAGEKEYPLDKFNDLIDKYWVS